MRSLDNYASSSRSCIQRHQLQAHARSVLNVSKWLQVRNLDGFARSIMRRIQEEGLDIGTGSLHELSRPVEDAILRFVDDGIVAESDFAHMQARLAPL